ncbi:MAG: protein-methionine-sulfoxide reductase catalytic subunit MsrP [Burkholderiaceae bacterium]
MSRADRRQIRGDGLSAEITPETIWRAHRRGLMKGLPAIAGGLAGLGLKASPLQPKDTRPLVAGKSAYVLMEPLTPIEDVTGYNNFYEFGTDKADPARRAPGRLKTSPWTVQITGLVQKPFTLDLDDLLKLAPLEERVYRLRCVEGWSMVIPWVGYSLSHLIQRARPLGSAKFVSFVTLADPAQMPGLSSPVLDWPYREGLRMDEARHPLTLLSLGLYGQTLPAQNGAPVRLVVPWKYGFKSAKSIVRIEFLEQEPKTSWMLAAPQEYGFYSNVNPSVPHPRWSQASERRIGEGGLFSPRRATRPFNGYADQVEGLYRGMDLRRFF